jgi:hypothetical protein
MDRGELVVMFLRPEAHRYSGGRPEISVDLDDDHGTTVVLTIEAGPGETFDDRDLWRSLTPTEARELAAMLWHQADAAERYS